MENITPQEFHKQPGLETRVLTPQEFLEMDRHSNLVEINILKLLENNPNLIVEIAQAVDGEPLEIKIIQDGAIIFYDNLEAIQRLKIQKIKPSDTTY